MMRLFKRRFRFYKRIQLADAEIYLHLRQTAPAVPARGYLPTYYFDICRQIDDAVVGRCDLRVGGREGMRYAGHIGYAVHEPYRGNRYALKACLLLETLARKHDMQALIVTASPENTASRRTIELFGAKYLERVRVPPDNELYALGQREKCVYEKDLTAEG